MVGSKLRRISEEAVKSVGDHCCVQFPDGQDYPLRFREAARALHLLLYSLTKGRNQQIGFPVLLKREQLFHRFTRVPIVPIQID